MKKTQLVIYNFGKNITKAQALQQLQSVVAPAAQAAEASAIPTPAPVPAPTGTQAAAASQISISGLPGLVKIFKNFKNMELYLRFESQEQVEHALQLLQQRDAHWRLEMLDDSFTGQKGQKRHYEEDEQDGDQTEEGADDSKGSRAKRQKKAKPQRPITEVVTPLGHLPYEQQLEHKENELVKMLRQKVAKELFQAWKAAEGDQALKTPSYLVIDNILAAKDKQVAAQQEAASAAEKSELRLDTEKNLRFLPFDWHGIRSSPVINGYRNHCEFTIGYADEARTENSVGFLQGNFSEGYTSVSHPRDCLNVNEEMKHVCTLMKQFIDTNRNAHLLKSYSKVDQTGFWRLLKVRDNLNKDMMLMFQIKPSGIPDDVLAQAKQDLVSFFTEKSNDPSQEIKVNIKSMYVQTFEGISNAAPTDSPLEKIFGDDELIETVLGCTFRISPMSFFQVNTKGAELLYTIAREWCSASPEETLLDICCGTGTISLIMSSGVRHVVGLEMVEAAVEDAKRNAKMNGIENVEFVCGKAEDTIKQVIEKEKAKNAKLTAIVDPPRSGLHPSVLKALLNTAEIQRLVYVSCNPKTLADNVKILCGPPKKSTNKFAGGPAPVPFRPLKALAVDMFPHTEHCEMVMYFERFRENQQQQAT